MTFEYPAKEAVDPLEDECTAIPPHVMTLAADISGEDGYLIFFDPRRGTITLIDVCVGPHGAGMVSNEVNFPNRFLDKVLNNVLSETVPNPDDGNFARQLTMTPVSVGGSTTL